MVVQHNLKAENANRMLDRTQQAQSKSTEKLSSGYKINRAADDAAGLSISEKMRKQIRGLNRASANAEDGISAMQTAEGALSEVHDMLQRMNALCIQAATGTNSREDRQSIQDEIAELNAEINRVAYSTKFNETFLLQGISSTHTLYLNAHDAGFAGIDFEESDANAATLKGEGVRKFDLTMSDLGISLGDKLAIGGKEYTIGEKVEKAADISKDYQFVSDTYACKSDDTLIDFAKAKQLIAAEIVQASSIGAKSDTARASIYNDAAGGALDVSKDANLAETDKNSSFYIKLATTTVNDDLDFNLHVGADSVVTNKIFVSIAAMDAKYLGIDGIDVVGDNDTTAGMSATYAVDAVADAISKVSEQRSALGAIQNRLEHTTGNLDNVVENTTSADSRIRDTDMADEMIDYSKNRILSWSGLAMLAQANSSTLNVLYLLRS